MHRVSVRRYIAQMAALAAVLSATSAACTNQSTATETEATTAEPEAAALTAEASVTDAGAAGGLFQKPHPWTRDVSQLKESSRSDAIIRTLTNAGGWGAGDRFRIDFGLALLAADSSTPRREVTAPDSGYCFGGGPDCDPLPLEVPLPANGFAEGSDSYSCDTENADCHVLVHDRSADKLYELYQATSRGGEIAATAAVVWDLGRQYGDALRGDQCTSADAAGLPMAALLATADEVAAGVIPHALRFTLPNDRIKSKVYVRPATHAGGPRSADRNAPPYGVRFRLKADFDEAPYGEGARVVLRALKTYGMILSDGGQIALTFADDRPSTAKWADVGIDAGTFDTIRVDDFEVVDLGEEIALTYDCVREP